MKPSNMFSEKFAHLSREKKEFVLADLIYTFAAGDQDKFKPEFSMIEDMSFPAVDYKYEALLYALNKVYLKRNDKKYLVKLLESISSDKEYFND